MEKVAEWLEAAIENSHPKNISLYVIILFVMLIGAASLYFLLNSAA